MGADRRPVCLRCAQIKQACDGSLPCSRCTRLSLPCRPRDAPASQGLHAIALSRSGSAMSSCDPVTALEAEAGLPKAKIRRVQTGCLMCKRRKKKCDEVKPKCGDCRRLCLDCAWPAERTRAKHHSPSASKSSITQDTFAAPNPFLPLSAPTHLDMFFKEEEMMRAYSPSSSSGCGSASEFDSRKDSIASFNTSNMTDLDLVNFDSASWNGSASPEQSWPDAFTAPLSVVTSTLSNPAATVTSNSSPSDSVPSITLTTYVPQTLPQLSSHLDRALLNHYSSVVASILSRRPSSSNPYTHYLLPMAHSNELVLHCILALSGNHWRKMQPAMASRGLWHQSQAQSGLAKLLSHVNNTSGDIALVGSLLLCMTELFDGQSQGWELHLKGAKRLLSAFRKHQGQSWTGQHKFLLRLARFLDSAATTSTCRPPLMGEEETEARTLQGLAGEPEVEDASVYGIPRELFHLVDEVNTLAAKRKTRIDAVSEARFRLYASIVEDKLNTWSFERNGVSTGAAFATAMDRRLSSAGGTHALDVHNATVAYEYALRLRLHQIIEGYNIVHPAVQPLVATILSSVQSIRYGSPLESCLLFPLVMAGGACNSTEDRVIIQDKLLVMERTCGFGYVYNARLLVERVWGRRDEALGMEAAAEFNLNTALNGVLCGNGLGEKESDLVNWAKIRYEEMHGLVVF